MQVGEELWQVADMFGPPKRWRGSWGPLQEGGAIVVESGGNLALSKCTLMRNIAGSVRVVLVVP
jgi:hypothetical protein